MLLQAVVSNISELVVAHSFIMFQLTMCLNTELLSMTTVRGCLKISDHVQETMICRNCSQSSSGEELELAEGKYAQVIL